MTKELTVPKGKDVVNVSVTAHTHVRLMDAQGKETFRFDSPGQHFTAFVRPGHYTIETDGKVGEVEFATLEPHIRTRSEADATKPPLAK
jgi:hypothetical protein